MKHSYMKVVVGIPMDHDNHCAFELMSAVDMDFADAAEEGALSLPSDYYDSVALVEHVVEAPKE